MQKFPTTHDLVRRACDWLGRQNRFSSFLDWAASWAVPTAPHLILSAPGVGDTPEARWMRPVLMATGPDLDITDGGLVRDAPSTPHLSQGAYDVNQDPAQPGYSGAPRTSSGTALGAHDRSKWQARMDHSPTACNEDKYKGMHGRPCKYAGGTDAKCPTGTLAGWFWRYKTPVGVYYYVDCCGKKVISNVWCNWTSEANWCIAAGSNHGYAAKRALTDDTWETYTCTLAIPDGHMKTVMDTASSEGKTVTQYHVKGLD